MSWMKRGQAIQTKTRLPLLVQSTHEKMAILGGSVDQRGIPLAGSAPFKPDGILESNHPCRLLVDPAGSRRIFCRRVGTRLALALPAQANQIH